MRSASKSARRVTQRRGRIIPAMATAVERALTRAGVELIPGRRRAGRVLQEEGTPVRSRRGADATIGSGGDLGGVGSGSSGTSGGLSGAGSSAGFPGAGSGTGFGVGESGGVIGRIGMCPSQSQQEMLSLLDSSSGINRHVQPSGSGGSACPSWTAAVWPVGVPAKFSNS